MILPSATYDNALANGLGMLHSVKMQYPAEGEARKNFYRQLRGGKEPTNPREVGRPEVSNPDLSSVAWTPGARLDITIPTDADRQLLGTVKFGDSRSGLTQSQIGAIRLNGKEAVLASDGHIDYRYTGLIFTVR